MSSEMSFAAGMSVLNREEILAVETIQEYQQHEVHSMVSPRGTYTM